MPVATCSTSASTCSQIAAISLMKLILVARNALLAYLIISAVRRSVLTTGGSRLKPPYRAATPSTASAITATDHDAIGREKVGYRRAFAQELRIADDRHAHVRLH